MKFKYIFLGLITISLMWNCKDSNEQGERKIITEDIRYEAQLSALNSHVTGLETSGKAEFLLSNDTLYVTDRKSTRLNSSHVAISYAVFCLKKKKKYISQID